MKLIEAKREFKPITIQLTTQEEVNFMHDFLTHIGSKSFGFDSMNLYLLFQPYVPNYGMRHNAFCEKMKHVFGKD
jgi:hypothetical protein